LPSDESWGGSILAAALSFGDAWRSLRASRACGKTCGQQGGPVLPVWEKAEMNYLLVFIGGGLGSTLRHIVNVVCPRLLGTAFPYHTFIINITGSIIMGLIAGYLAFKGGASQPWRLFLMTGVLGGYTTFSAFSLDAALLYERGAIGLALFYVLGSVVFSIAGLFAGLALVRHFT
jgi:fluoride exporter